MISLDETTTKKITIRGKIKKENKYKPVKIRYEQFIRLISHKYD